MLIKMCNRCKVDKSTVEFQRNKQTKDGLQDWCKPCISEYRKEYRRSNLDKFLVVEREYAAQRRKKNLPLVQDIHRRSHLKTTYNITLEQYEQMFTQQNYACKICLVPFELQVQVSRTKLPYVDHDHNTGVVRGLLCSTCNAMLGMAKDNPLLLQAAIEYLAQFTTKVSEL